MTLSQIIAELIIGSVLLGYGAERVVTSSACLARYLKMPSLLIGMILVGFGTSLPELIVSAVASFHGESQMAIGNVVGSNIANIGLILSVVALITPIQVHRRLVRCELPILIMISLMLGILLSNDYLTRVEGILLIFFLIVHLYWTSLTVIKKQSILKNQLPQAELVKVNMSFRKSIFWWLFGLVLLFFSSRLLVVGAENTVHLLGMSELVVGLTVVTICTSLPEFATTLIGVLKKEHDIAIGHIVGSNLFNSLAVMAMPALISPGPVESQVFSRDYPVMMVFTFGLWVFTLAASRRGLIGLKFGFLFLLAYIGYLILLISSI